MKFWYDVIESRSINIDFEELFDIIKERLLEDEPEVSTYDVYQEFTDNVQYYVSSIYPADDFDASENESNVEDLVCCWEKWFEEKFGENWDEI